MNQETTTDFLIRKNILTPEEVIKHDLLDKWSPDLVYPDKIEWGSVEFKGGDSLCVVMRSQKNKDLFVFSIKDGLKDKTPEEVVDIALGAMVDLFDNNKETFLSEKAGI